MIRKPIPALGAMRGVSTLPPDLRALVLLGRLVLRKSCTAGNGGSAEAPGRAPLLPPGTISGEAFVARARLWVPVGLVPSRAGRPLA